MGLLTTAEAARRLSEALGKPVQTRNVQDAARKGRLRGEKKPGRSGHYLIPEEELQRILEERKLSQGEKAGAEERSSRLVEQIQEECERDPDYRAYVDAQVEQGDSFVFNPGGKRPWSLLRLVDPPGEAPSPKRKGR